APDGGIIVSCMAQDQRDKMLELDEATGQFHEIRHPEGREIVLMAPRREGNLWAATLAERTHGFRLEIYDGITFRPVLDTTPVWAGADLRIILERSQDELWFGGTAGGCKFQAGKFSLPFVKEQGYTENGVFMIKELRSG